MPWLKSSVRTSCLVDVGLGLPAKVGGFFGTGGGAFLGVSSLAMRVLLTLLGGGFGGSLGRPAVFSFSVSSRSISVPVGTRRLGGGGGRLVTALVGRWGAGLLLLSLLS